MTKKLWWSSLVTFAVFAQSALADGNVISLDASNFNDNVLHQETILVKYFAPWCSYCQKLAPEYEAAAAALKPYGVPLAEVDCTVNVELCQKKEIRSYPTLKLFQNGQESDYTEGRTAREIVSFMKKLAVPAVTEINSNNFESFKALDEVVFVGYVSPSDEASIAAYKDTVEPMRDAVPFGIVTDEALAKEHGVTSLPTLVAYKQFDEGRSEQAGMFEQPSIQKFVASNVLPLFGEINASNFHKYLLSGRPLAFLFADSKHVLEPLLQELKPAATKYKGDILFVHIDASRFGSHATTLGLKQEWPAFAIHRIDRDSKYPFDQSNNITLSNIEQFLKDFKEDKIAEYIAPETEAAEVKTEDTAAGKEATSKQKLDAALTKEASPNSVTEVETSDFDTIVKDTTKDVFLEIYAPWCGHCNKLAPTWTELGQLVASQHLSDKLVIAKMDGTQYTLPNDAGFTIHGYPTMKLVKAETNEVVDYTGSRTLDDFVQFLNEKGSKTYILKTPNTVAMETLNKDLDNDQGLSRDQEQGIREGQDQVHEHDEL